MPLLFPEHGARSRSGETASCCSESGKQPSNGSAAAESRSTQDHKYVCQERIGYPACAMHLSAAIDCCQPAGATNRSTTAVPALQIEAAA